MAVMYPQRLPDSVLNSKMLRGEIEVYNALAALPDEYEVFYNRTVDLAQTSKAHKRRIDFIVLHPNWGLLCIEVKGGKIRIGKDGGVEQYHYTPRPGGWTTINPYRQVERATIELIKNAKADGANYWIEENVCVLFPDTLRRDITDLPQTLPNGTLCADDLPLLPTLIPQQYSGKINKKQVWEHSAFLDMRRRLQNMPEHVFKPRESKGRNKQEHSPSQSVSPNPAQSQGWSQKTTQSHPRSQPESKIFSQPQNQTQNLYFERPWKSGRKERKFTPLDDLRYLRGSLDYDDVGGVEVDETTLLYPDDDFVDIYDTINESAPAPIGYIPKGRAALKTWHIIAAFGIAMPLAWAVVRFLR